MFAEDPNVTVFTGPGATEVTLPTVPASRGWRRTRCRSSDRRPRMATIETLNGPLDTAELGTVLMHEHIFNITAEIQIAHPGFNGWDPEVEIPKAQREAARGQGGGDRHDRRAEPDRPRPLARPDPPRVRGHRPERRARHRPLHVRRAAAPVALQRPGHAARRRRAARRAHARRPRARASRAAASSPGSSSARSTPPA